MSREEAVKILRRNRLSYDEQEAEQFCEAYEMAISALNSLEEVYAKGYDDGFSQAEVNYENDKALSQEPKTQMIDKSNFDIEQYKMDLQGAYDCGFEAGKRLEQEPCTDTVSIRKDVLKCRVGNIVAYNVEWLKKHWQMEMDIVCGVKPCDDAISRDAERNEMIDICLEIIDRHTQ